MKQQKIYIDGLGLVDGHFSGVGQYILGIIRGIDQLLDEASSRGETLPNIKVIVPYDTVYKFKKFKFKHVTYCAFPIPFRYMAGLWHRGKLPWVDLWCGRGTYIFPRFVDMPLLFSRASSLTIFDLSYELHREYSDEGNAAFLSKRVKDSIDRTSTVITISENAKREIVKFYNKKSSDVLVAPPAVDQKHFYRRSSQEIDIVKLKYGITAKNYILALSNLEPRKNLGALVEAYCELPESVRKDTALLLVGVSGWKAEALFEDIIARVKQGYDIIRPSKYVTDTDKPAVISGASMLVYPSHYEGFGMPPLEALACGVPVITADNSSLPEVVKGVGTMIPSNDNKKLYSAMLQYLQDIQAETEKVRNAGPKRASEFSWSKSAALYLKAAGVVNK